jgi:hypothetical protein
MLAGLLALAGGFDLTAQGFLAVVDQPDTARPLCGGKGCNALFGQVLLCLCWIMAEEATVDDAG